MLKTKHLGMVVYAYNPSTQEAEENKITLNLSSLDWTTKLINSRLLRAVYQDICL